MGLEPIDNDTVALGAWRLTDVLDNLRDDTPPDQVRQMLPYYYKKSQGYSPAISFFSAMYKSACLGWLR